MRLFTCMIGSVLSLRINKKQKRAHWESNPGLRTRNPMHYHYAIRPSQLHIQQIHYILFVNIKNHLTVLLLLSAIQFASLSYNSFEPLKCTPLLCRPPHCYSHFTGYLFGCCLPSHLTASFFFGGNYSDHQLHCLRNR